MGLGISDKMVKPIIFYEEYWHISVIVLIEQKKMMNTEKLNTQLSEMILKINLHLRAILNKNLWMLPMSRLEIMLSF